MIYFWDVIEMIYFWDSLIKIFCNDLFLIFIPQPSNNSWNFPSSASDTFNTEILQALKLETYAPLVRSQRRCNDDGGLGMMDDDCQICTKSVVHTDSCAWEQAWCWAGAHTRSRGLCKQSAAGSTHWAASGVHLHQAEAWDNKYAHSRNVV